MTPGSVHEELRDDLAAYALGALGREEAAAVADHLAGCEPCRDYVRWLRPAVDLLPASVTPVEPPARLRERLMETVRAEAAQAGAAQAETAREQPAGEPVGRWRSWRGLVLRPATGLAAVGVLAAGLVAGYALNDSSGERIQVQAQPTGEVPAGAISATLEHGAGGDAILHVHRIPALDRDHVYEAWASRGAEVQPLTSFRPRRNGTGEVVLPESLDGASAVLVTEEPREVGASPSTAPILRASLG